MVTAPLNPILITANDKPRRILPVLFNHYNTAILT